MTVATLVLVVIAVFLLVYAWRRGDGSHRRGMQQGWETLKRTWLLLLVAFVIVGYVNVLSPQALIQQWLGPESGWSGLLLAEFIGLLLPGGPYVVFPLIGILYEAGAGLGQAVTLVTSWAMLALISVAFELPFMGWRFTAVRWGVGLIFPLLVGALAQLIFSPLIGL
jgi:uncharacterized membrane protein YraQ (UPF0718 family)